MKKSYFIILLSAVFLCSCNASNTAVSPENPTFSDGESNADSEDTVIKIAMFGDGFFGYDSYVEDFNNADNGYKIEAVNYRNYIDETADDPIMGMALADMQLNQDIIKGGVVDIVFNFSFVNEGYYDIMENKGAFIDLYELMEKDSDFDSSALNRRILSLYEKNNSLYRLPTFYAVGTMFGTKKYVGDRQNWTVDELMECYSNAPENATFNLSNDSMHVFFDLVRNDLGRFIDYEKGTCNFTDPEFVKMLKFCAGFQKWDGTANNVDYDAPLFAEDRFIYSFEGYHEILQEFVRMGEECTPVGYPSEDGCGAYIECSDACFSICMASTEKAKQGAWEFIKGLLSEEMQTERFERSEAVGFPINVNAFEKEARAAMGTGENIVSIQGDKYDIGWFTEDEYAELTAYIAAAKRVKTTVYTQLNKIIEDEVMSCFNGEHTPEETAEMIQNRAAIMVSEMAQ